MGVQIAQEHPPERTRAQYTRATAREATVSKKRKQRQQRWQQILLCDCERSASPGRVVCRVANKRWRNYWRLPRVSLPSVVYKTGFPPLLDLRRLCAERAASSNAALAVSGISPSTRREPLMSFPRPTSYAHACPGAICEKPPK